MFKQINRFFGDAFKSLYRVFFPDERLIQSLEMPSQIICNLELKWGNGGTTFGTGWFIDSKTIVTAGHNILGEEGEGVTSITILLHRFKDEPSLVKIPFSQVKRPFLPTEFEQNPESYSDFDYAVICLNEPVDIGETYFLIKNLDDAALDNREVVVSGYQGGTTQFFAKGKITLNSSSYPNLLLYQIDTDDGQSGGPVWFNEGNEFVAIGIHTGTTRDEDYNVAIRINQQVENNINTWRA